MKKLLFVLLISVYTAPLLLAQSVVIDEKVLGLLNKPITHSDVFYFKHKICELPFESETEEGGNGIFLHLSKKNKDNSECVKAIQFYWLENMNDKSIIQPLMDYFGVSNDLKNLKKSFRSRTTGLRHKLLEKKKSNLNWVHFWYKIPELQILLYLEYTPEGKLSILQVSERGHFDEGDTYPPAKEFFAAYEKGEL